MHKHHFQFTWKLICICFVCFRLHGKSELESTEAIWPNESLWAILRWIAYTRIIFSGYIGFLVFTATNKHLFKHTLPLDLRAVYSVHMYVHYKYIYLFMYIISVWGVVICFALHVTTIRGMVKLNFRIHHHAPIRYSQLCCVFQFIMLIMFVNGKVFCCQRNKSKMLVNRWRKLKL